MERYQDWVQNKDYQRHLNQLSKIRVRSLRPNKSQKIKVKSTLNNPQKKQDKIIKTHRKDILNHFGSSIKLKREIIQSLQTERVMTLQEQQVLLENYLLCERLNHTPPVISKFDHDKQYSNHKKALKRLARSQSAVQSQRDQKFNRYQSSSANKSISNNKSAKFKLSMQIGNIMFIKNKLETRNQCMYQIGIPAERKYSKMLNYRDFTSQQIQFNIPKVSQKVKFKILQIKGLLTFELGQFYVQFSNSHVKQERGKKKYIQVIKNNKMIQGTIELSVEVSPNTNK